MSRTARQGAARAEKIAALSQKRGRYEAMLAQLDRTGEDQISLTDPDSRAMAAYTQVGVGYNMLTQTAEPTREFLGVETIDVVADRGYFKIEDIAACEKAGCIPHVPRPQRGSSAREGLFRKDEFRYDAERDAYVCPAGKLLTPIRSNQRGGSTTSGAEGPTWKHDPARGESGFM